MEQASDSGEAIRSGYALDAIAAGRLAERLLIERPPSSNDRFVCYMLDGSDQASDMGRYVERVVFEQSFDNDSQEMVQEYGAYEPSSSFFVVIDQDVGAPVGALRIIRDSEQGLKTMNDIAEQLEISLDTFTGYHDVADVADCWDVGTVAVLREYRQVDHRMVSNMLYRAMHLRATHEGVEHYVSVIDSRARKIFDLLGIPFKPLAGTEPFEYLGSQDSQAMYGDATQFIPGVHKRYKEANLIEKFVLRRYAGRLVLGKNIDSKLQFDFS